MARRTPPRSSYRPKYDDDRRDGRYSSRTDRYDSRGRDREQRRGRSPVREHRGRSPPPMPRDTHKPRDIVPHKRRRSPSPSSSSSSGYSSRSRSRSLISCSTCSGYYSLHSSSSRSRSRSSSSDSSEHQAPHRKTQSTATSRYGYTPKPVPKRPAFSRPISREERPDWGLLDPVHPKPSLDRAIPRDPRARAWPVPSTFKTVTLEADENWVYKNLPEHILVTNLSPSIKSKVQLLGIIESQISVELAKMISEIELHSNELDSFASVKFSTGVQCYKCFTERIKSFEALSWIMSLDRDQNQFRKRLAAVKPAEVKRREPEKAKVDLATCDPAIPCLLVDYEFFSSRNSSRDLLEIFKSFRPRGVERMRECWHVHMEFEEDVEAAYVQRYSFLHHGRRIRPYLSRRDQRELSPNLVKTNVRRTESLDDIRTLILQQTTKAIPSEHVKIFEPITSSAIDEKLSKLPIFNKKVLERLQELAAANVDAEEDEDEEEVNEIIEDIPEPLVMDEVSIDHIEPEYIEPVKKTRASRRKVNPDIIEPSPVEVDEIPSNIDNLGELGEGSARLAGFFKQKKKTVWFEPIEEQVRSSAATIPTGRGRSSRSDRNIMAELVGKLSSLHLRQKHVVLGRSSIHSYGLFAGEDIEPGEFVIEYVGQVIRHSLANIRERRLEEELKAAGSTEMASSYFFRLDLTFVVDATKIGNLARFINHSCEPNCTAKVVQVEGAPHIVFYARKLIGRGEEITYDYKFAIDDDPAKKIKCLCGTPGCRKSLN